MAIQTESVTYTAGGTTLRGVLATDAAPNPAAGPACWWCTSGGA